MTLILSFNIVLSVTLSTAAFASLIPIIVVVIIIAIIIILSRRKLNRLLQDTYEMTPIETSTPFVSPDILSFPLPSADTADTSVNPSPYGQYGFKPAIRQEVHHMLLWRVIMVHLHVKEDILSL